MKYNCVFQTACATNEQMSSDLKKKAEPTFLFSITVRGFSGVESPLAGVAATADGAVLSKVPAGIFSFVASVYRWEQTQTHQGQKCCSTTSPAFSRGGHQVTDDKQEWLSLRGELTPTLHVMPAPRVIFIELESARERLVCEFLGSITLSNGARGPTARPVPGRAAHPSPNRDHCHFHWGLICTSSWESPGLGGAPVCSKDHSA